MTLLLLNYALSPLSIEIYPRIHEKSYLSTTVRILFESTNSLPSFVCIIEYDAWFTNKCSPTLKFLWGWQALNSLLRNCSTNNRPHSSW